MQCRLMLRGEDEKQRARRAGIEDLNAKWDVGQMVRGDVMFAATGITDGHLLKGVRFHKGGAISHSMVMRSMTGTIRTLTARHDFDRHVKLHDR